MVNFNNILLIFSFYLINSILSVPLIFPTCPSYSQQICTQTEGCAWGQCYGTVDFSLIDCSQYQDIFSCQNLGCDFYGCVPTDDFTAYQAPMQWPADCSVFSTNTSCNMWGCTWSSTNNNCSGNFVSPLQCADLSASPQMCWLANGCYWTDGYCSGPSNNWTYSAVNPKTCTQLPVEACDPGFGCTNTCNGVAGPKCTNFADVTTCSVYPGCSWNFTANVCYGNISVNFDCSYFSADVCTTISGCSLRNGCTYQSCPNISNYDACQATAGCIWYMSSCMYNLNLNPGSSGYTLTKNTLLIIIWGVFYVLFNW